MPYKSEPVPSKYVREAQFGEHSAVEPSKPHDGNHLDNEYDELAHCTSDIIDFILQTIDADGNIIDGHIPQLDDKVDVEGDTMTGSLVINEDLTVLGDTDLNKLKAKNAEIDDVVAKTAIHSPVVYTDKLQMNEGINIHESAGVKWLSGKGHPEGKVIASPGSIYTQTDATPFASVLFMKEASTGTTGWAEVTTSIHIGPTPPNNTYQLWYKTTGTGAGNTYLYYTDTDSSQWVPLSPSGGSGGEPGIGDLNNYVMRPYPKNANAWMVYNDYTRQWTAVTTDLVATNPDEIRAGFNIPDEEAELLVDQLRVNRYILSNYQKLQNDIIELEEEIDALAPTLERGSWKFNPAGSAGPSMFAMYAAGTTTSEYAQADQIFINTVDTDGKLHNFNDVEVGSYLEIFSPDDGDYGLYKVTEKSDETSGANSFWMFDVEHSRSNRPSADADSEDNCRFKFFTIADATDPTSFVIKAGDNMEGQLDMEGKKGRNKIINLADPIEDHHAVNKKYVDQGLKDQFSAAFFEVLDSYGSVENATTPSMAAGAGFGDNKVKYWVKPPSEGFFKTGESIYINEDGPYKLDDVTGGNKWNTFFITNGPRPTVGTTCTFSTSSLTKSRELFTETTEVVTLTSRGNAKWSKGSLPDTTTGGYVYFGIEKFNDNSSTIASGNTLYLNKLWNDKFKLLNVSLYEPTGGSFIEVFLGNELVFKSQLDSNTWREGRTANQMMCNLTTHPLISSSNAWDAWTYYKVLLTNMRAIP